MGMNVDIRRSNVTWGLVVAVVAVLQGAAIALNPEIGLYVFAALCLVGALAIPPTFLLGLALVSVVSMRFLVIIEWLPASAAFADIPVVWLALAVALIRTHAPARARPILIGLCALMGSVVLAWALNPSEVLRPVIGFMLLGQPFAVVAAILLTPPSDRGRRILVRLIVSVLAIQVVVGLFQWQAFGAGDPVTGTINSPHVLGAICALGILFCFNSRYRARFIIIAILAPVLVLSDSKQVYVALAPALIVMGFLSARRFRLTTATTVAVIMVPLLLSVPAVTDRWDDLKTSDTGKAIAIQFLRREATPIAIAFGHGPAETVSRSAALTLDTIVREGSALRALDLRPAEMTTEAYALYDRLHPNKYERTSVNDPLSSALGVFGDLGLLGLVVMLWLVWRVIRSAHDVPYRSAVIAAWTMYLILGLVYAWWEEPTFSILLGLLTGLALTNHRPALQPHHVIAS